jgi:hypothetical protein
MKKIFTLLFLAAFGSTPMFAQAVGDYGSIATGNWNGTTTWGIWDGATFVATTTPPDGTQNVFIQPSFTVTVTALVNFRKTLTLNGGFMVAGTSPNNFQTSGTTAVITRANATGTLTGTCTLSALSSNDVTTVNINVTTPNGGSETNSGGGTLGKVHLNIASGVNYLLNGNRQFDNLDLQGTISDFSATARTFTVKGNITGTGTQTGTAAATGIIMNFNSNSINISGVTLKNLTISTTNGNTFNLTGNVTVSNVLALTGQPASLVNRINLSTFNLTVGSITLGLDPTKNYVRADGAGRLIIKNVTTNVVFPIGTGAEYLPITSFVNTGTADDFGAKVQTGSSPSCTTAGDALTASWDVNEAVAGGSNVAMTVQYNAATPKGASFATASAFLFHCNGLTADVSGGVGASGAGPFTNSITGVTTFSPFGVAKSAVLPVELTKFDVKRSQNAAILTWSTASEKSNAAFHIEQSTNGRDFQTIGQVKGKGTTNAASDYSFEHTTPSVGINYYRLKQVDFDGMTTLSAVKSLMFGKSGLVVKNTLAHDVVNVIVGEDATTISIFNISGQTVLTTNVQGEQSLDVSALPLGLYHIRTVTGDVARFVKQ